MFEFLDLLKIFALIAAVWFGLIGWKFMSLPRSRACGSSH